MSDESISSPPYPSDIVTAKGLYHYLQLLQSWLAGVLPGIKQEMTELAWKQTVPNAREAIEHGRDQLHDVGALPPATVWEGVGLSDAFQTFQYLRMARERWDQILREHEDSWDSKLAVFKRFSVMCLAQVILEEAFTSPEVREMKQQKAYARLAAQQKAIQKHLNQVLLPPEMRDDAESGPAVDSSDWFGSKTEEEDDDG